MNITTETTDEFMGKAEGMIHRMGGSVDIVTFLKELYDYAAERSTTYIPVRYELATPQHETGIDGKFLDFNSMLLAIILLSWAIRYRKVKADDGQCHVHIKGCKETAKLHSSIYDQWIEVVEEVLKALRVGRPGYT